MILIDPNRILVYTFDNNSVCRTTIDKLQLMATEVYKEVIDYDRLMKDNDIQNDWYYSSTEGEFYHIQKLPDGHLTNALLKKFREFFIPANFTGLKHSEVIEKIANIRKLDLEIDMLCKEFEERAQDDYNSNRS